MMSFIVGAITTCIMTLGYGGMIGGHLHSGVDYFCGYLTPVYSPYNGFVVFRDDSEGSIAIVVESPSPRLFVVAHMASTISLVGGAVKAGDILGLEGYSGEVYFNGARENSRAASHRHYSVYPLAEDTAVNPKEFYVTFGDDWYRSERGNYFRILNPNNEYGGACDPVECLE